MFNVLICARDLLKNEQGLPEDQLRKMLNDTISSMEGVESKLTQAFPVVGGRIQALTSLKDSLENMKLNTEEDVSRLQDADITQVAIDLARYDVLYQMSLSVASKMFSLSFLDFLE
jgi:flagellin-like hook-associated protein FlgL